MNQQTKTTKRTLRSRCIAVPQFKLLYTICKRPKARSYRTKRRIRTTICKNHWNLNLNSKRIINRANTYKKGSHVSIAPSSRTWRKKNTNGRKLSQFHTSPVGPFWPRSGFCPNQWVKNRMTLNCSRIYGRSLVERVIRLKASQSITYFICFWSFGEPKFQIRKEKSILAVWTSLNKCLATWASTLRLTSKANLWLDLADKRRSSATSKTCTSTVCSSKGSKSQ